MEIQEEVDNIRVVVLKLYTKIFSWGYFAVKLSNMHHTSLCADWLSLTQWLPALYCKDRIWWTNNLVSLFFSKNTAPGIHAVCIVTYKVTTAVKFAIFFPAFILSMCFDHLMNNARTLKTMLQEQSIWEREITLTTVINYLVYQTKISLFLSFKY